MKRIPITKETPHSEAIQQAVAVLKQGGVIIYPTDTCYGLGVDARDKSAVRRLAAMKNRDQNSMPFSVIVQSIDQMRTIAKIDDAADKILHRHLPGPFTFVLVNLEFRIVRTSSIYVRIPRSTTTSMIATEFGSPYTTTSANETGLASPYSYRDIEEYLLRPLKARNRALPDLMLDAGTLPNHKPSTIVDLTGLEPKILREGSGIFRG